MLLLSLVLNPELTCEVEATPPIPLRYTTAASTQPHLCSTDANRQVGVLHVPSVSQFSVTYA